MKRSELFRDLYGSTAENGSNLVIYDKRKDMVHLPRSQGMSSEDSEVLRSSEDSELVSKNKF